MSWIPQGVEEQKIATSKTDPVEELTAPEQTNLFYLVVNRKGSDQVMFKHHFDTSKTIIIPPQRLREALRTLSTELAPYETDCQIVKRGELPFILVWSENLAVIAAATHYTPMLHTSLRKILLFLEEEYLHVIQDGSSDLTGHVPIVERVKDELRPALLRKHPPPPPSLQVLTEEATNYYFSTTSGLIEQFDSIHVSSKGFQLLLDRESLEKDQIDMLMFTLKDKIASLTELSKLIDIPINKLALILRHLNLLELVILFSTPL
ncbi:MAG: hypothetical protein ACE5R6_04675 [Candidatus Heimdallarchaeota archaeon]